MNPWPSHPSTMANRRESQVTTSQFPIKSVCLRLETGVSDSVPVLTLPLSDAM